MLTVKELRSSTDNELQEELKKSSKELLKVRLSIRSKHEKDSSKAKKLKRYAAQIHTIIIELKKST